MPAKKKNASFIDSIVSPKGIGIILIILVLLSLGVYGYTRRTTYLSKLTPAPTIKPTPTPYPIFQGKQVYQLSATKDIKGPLPSTVTIDPYDPKQGQTQVITIKITHTSPVTSASVSLISDHKTQTYSLRRISGTDLEGEWQTTITTNDTHDYIYSLGLDFQSATSNFKKTMTFRAML